VLPDTSQHRIVAELDALQPNGGRAPGTRDRRWTGRLAPRPPRPRLQRRIV